MGLCKCPQKKVTNQFCFEHRVNVCEHCMVVNHPKCIVQSYLQWLQDSDYNPICELCKGELATGDCVRLMCYHVFHSDCLNSYAASFPAHTAPDGYLCPSCKTSIVPPDNMASPLAQHLRQVLSSVSWANAALPVPPTESKPSQPPSSNPMSGETPVTSTSHLSSKQAVVESSTSWPTSSTSFTQNEDYNSIQTGINSDRFTNTTTAFATVLSGPSTPRKLYDATDDDFLRNASFDHDENKYKRRSAVEWLARWFKSYTRPKGRHDPHRRFKRCAVVAVLIMLSLLTLIMIFKRLGRASADEDPLLDPMANPNIRVGQPMRTD